MEKVIIISKENHGTIGVAKNMQSAFALLLENNWLYEQSEFIENYNTPEEEWLTLYELQKKYECNSLFETLLYLWEKDKGYFDGCFYFEEMTLWEYNPK